MPKSDDLTPGAESQATSRRTLLKSAATGGGALIAAHMLPEKWVKPVVDSVLLPVHAQASGAPAPASPLGNFQLDVPTVVSLGSPSEDER